MRAFLGRQASLFIYWVFLIGTLPWLRPSPEFRGWLGAVTDFQLRSSEPVSVHGLNGLFHCFSMAYDDFLVLTQASVTIVEGRRDPESHRP